MNLFRKSLLLASVVAMATSITSCDSNEKGTADYNNERIPIELLEEESDKVSSLNDFSFNLLREAYKQNKSATKGNDVSNMVISPLSAAMTLGMLANADETMRHEILNILCIENGDIESLNSLSYTLLTRLPKMDKKSELYISNAIWHDKSLMPTFAYSSLMKGKYLAEIHSEDFADVKAIESINSWCERATSGRIPQIIDRLTGKVVWLNTMYFHGSWRDKFNKNMTYKCDYHNHSGTITKVDMMSQDLNDGCRGYSDDIIYAATLLYGNASYMMSAIIPTEGHTIEDVIDYLDSDVLLNMNYILNEAWAVDIPKFNIDTNLDVLDIVDKMTGNSSLRNLKLSGFGGEESTWEWFRQRTLFKVDEEGSTAAVASHAGTGDTAPPENGRIVLDEPFVFLIRERSTNAILFCGVVLNF